MKETLDPHVNIAKLASTIMLGTEFFYVTYGQVLEL